MINDHEDKLNKLNNHIQDLKDENERLKKSVTSLDVLDTEEKGEIKRLLSLNNKLETENKRLKKQIEELKSKYSKDVKKKSISRKRSKKRISKRRN